MGDDSDLLTDVPQLAKTAEERAARMQWFRDAKFGMFIHSGPCSVGEREIGWGRNAQRPWDINVPDPSDERYDAEYDKYYEVFNPLRYDPDAWLGFAKASGMKYLVLITKHHDGIEAPGRTARYLKLETPGEPPPPCASST